MESPLSMAAIVGLYDQTARGFRRQPPRGHETRSHQTPGPQVDPGSLTSTIEAVVMTDCSEEL
jgi:hypothetical protein